MTTLSEVWPLFSLRITTPRLELRPVRDEDLPGVIDAALSGIHDPGVMPFAVIVIVCRATSSVVPYDQLHVPSGCFSTMIFRCFILGVVAAGDDADLLGCDLVDKAVLFVDAL